MNVTDHSTPSACRGLPRGSSVCDVCLWQLIGKDFWRSQTTMSQVFGKSKEDFATMPGWKRDLVKKKKGLF